jgi:O-antigen ligase
MFVALRRILLFFTGATVPISLVQLFSVGPLVFTINKVITAALLVLVTLEVVTSGRSMPRNAKNFWIAAFGVSMGIGMIVSFLKLPDANVLVATTLMIVSIVLFYYLLLYVLVSRRDLDVLLAGLIVGVTVTAVTVLFGYDPSLQGGERTGGLRGDANTYSFIAVVTLPLVALYYFTATSRFRKVILLGMGLVILQGIIASLSRTGMVAMGGAFLLWALRFRRFDVLRYSVPVAIILGLVIAFAAPEWRERFSTMTTAEARAEDGSIQNRVIQYRVAALALASNPFVGVGLGGYERWATERRIEHGAPAVHNAYLHVMAELGLLGMVPYLMVLLLTWRDLSRAWLMARRKNARGDPELQRLYLYAVFLQIGFFGALLGNFFLDSLRYRESWILYASATVILSFVRVRVAELETEEAEVVAPWPGSEALPGVSFAGGARALGK